MTQTPKQKDSNQDPLRDHIDTIRTITENICRSRQYYSSKIKKNYLHKAIENSLLPPKGSFLSGLGYRKFSLRRKQEETTK